MPRFTKFAYLLAYYAISLSSCAILRPPIQIDTRDSTVVRYIDSTVVSVRDSIVLVPVPAESSSAILPAGFHSHVETSIAESDAYVEDGMLHHEIRNKSGATLPAVVPITTTAQVIRSDNNHSGLTVRTVTKEVERKLTWWQRFRIGAFWWLLAFALIGWRRELLAILRKIV